MTLRLEPLDEPLTSRCCDCGGDRVLFKGAANERGTTVAVFGAWLYHHDEAHEVFIDAILGTWDDDEAGDHVTFGARTGPVEGQSEPASTLVTGGAMAPDEPIYGRKLTREEALVHPWLPRFWEVNDLILTGIPAVHTHWTHQPPPPQRRQWWQI